MPFTVDQFYDVFRDYNEAVWPTQLLLIGLALIGVVLVIGSRSWSHAVVSGILAVLWVWLGVVYHLTFFARIHPLAYAFSAFSLCGAAVFETGSAREASIDMNSPADRRRIIE